MSERKEISRRKALKMGAAAGAIAFAGVPGIGRAGDEDAAVKSAEAEVEAGEKAAEKIEDALPQVPRRILGKTGASIPILLVGGGVKLDQRFDPKLAEAYRFGANYIDAADCYSNGTCETAVGNYHEKAKNRKNLWITSKSDKHDPKGFEETVNTSLEKMKTDWVDLYYLHALEDPNVFTKELKATVERLKKEGKIHHFGFSCHDGNVAELLHKAAETEWVESVMFRYNFREYGNEKLNKAIDACVDAKVGLIAMKTQSSEVSFQDAWKKFEKTGKWTKHQAVLKAVWADDRITAAVSHMDTLDKMKENLAAALDTKDLGDADWDALENYARNTRGQACQGCDHICGAVVDAPVKIGATLRYLMYHDAYGEPENARALFGRLPADARRISRVDFRPAKAVCPHGVDVARQMKRAAEVFRV